MKIETEPGENEIRIPEGLNAGDSYSNSELLAKLTAIGERQPENESLQANIKAFLEWLEDIPLNSEISFSCIDEGGSMYPFVVTRP